MSESKKPVGMPSLAQKEADYKKIYGECYENGSVDTDNTGKFVQRIAIYLKEHEKARDWTREAVGEKDLFLARQKQARAPGQPALFGVEAIYALGKIPDEKGVEKHRTVRGSDMTVAQAQLHVEFRASYARSVLIDTEMDLIPLRAAIAASTDASEKIAPIAARLGFVEKKQPETVKADAKNDVPAAPPPVA